MIAYPLSEGSNVINFYDKDFDISLSYSFRIVNSNFCKPAKVIQVDDVYFCDDYAKLSFELPYLEAGEYIIDVYDDLDTINTLYQFKAVFR